MSDEVREDGKGAVRILLGRVVAGTKMVKLQGQDSGYAEDHVVELGQQL